MSSDPWAGQVLLQILLLSVHAFFASADTAMAELNHAQLHHDADEGDQAAQRLMKLTKRSDAIKQTIHVILMLTECFAGAMAAVSLSRYAADLLHGCGVSLGETALSRWSIVIVVLMAVFIYQLVGSLLPRKVTMRAPEKMAAKYLNVLLVLTNLLSPVVYLLNLFSNLLLRLFGIDPKAEQEEVTEEEILMMVDMGEETGAIESTEKEMIENIFEFNNRTAEDVMIHRTNVTAIWVEEDRDNIIKIIQETGLSRFPVFDEDIDDVIGILNTRDYLLDCHREHPQSLRTLLREAFFVPSTVQADALFRDMQKRKVHMAVVVDEYGGMDGIVTMEDLLEEIVGNIYDEFDPQTEADIVKLDDNTWRMAGSVSLEEASEALGVDLPEDDGYDTLGGMIFDQFTTIPTDGSTPTVEVAGLRIRVEQIQEHRVERAIVIKLDHTENEEQREVNEASRSDDDE